MKLKHYIIGIAVIIIDQLSKLLVTNKNITIIPNFLKFTYTENTGGAFGIGTKLAILALSIIIIVSIIIFLIKQKNKITNFTPYILILSGSIGNLIDRTFRGYVIDFIDVNIFNFPTFNIADISIVLGIIYLIFLIIMQKSDDKNVKIWYI